MKLIDKTVEREKEKQSSIKKIQQIEEASKKKKEEAYIPKIEFISDWRIEQEYNKAIENEVLFIQQVEARRGQFLKMALENRDKIKELVVDGYEPNRQYPIEISIESNKEDIEILQTEARKLGLSYGEYIRAIYYTTALEINKKKLESQARQKEKEIEARLFEFSGHINQQLRRKLEEKYGEQQHFTVPGLSGITYGYGDMLIDLANEYFELDKQ